MAVVRSGTAGTVDLAQELNPIGGRPDGLRLTPMEIDVQLQVAELTFRNLLEGKRLMVEPCQQRDDWYRKHLGEDWVERNKLQRQEVKRQMDEDGENTPMWTEALANTSDIAWEVLEVGRQGREKVRQLKDVDRTEVLEQFRSLLPKVSVSHYARCGAGDQLGGLRACIAVLRLFIRDAEVLGACACCLRLIITDHSYNRDGLAAISLPTPPAERGEDHVDRGWSFLRAALDAFATQAGAEPFQSETEEDQE